MKTKEFISKMDDVAGATTIITSCGTIEVYNLEGKMIGWVSNDKFGVVVTSYIALDNMKNKEEVVKLLFDYALTPLDKRDYDDKLKFRVKMLPGKFNGNTYLNQGKRSKDIFLSLPDEDDADAQTVFTKSEYDKLKQKYHDWLPKFDEKDPHFEFVEEDK